MSLFQRTKYSTDATISTSVAAVHTDYWSTQRGTNVSVDGKIANPSTKVLCYTAPPDVILNDVNGWASAIAPSVASPNETWFLHKANKFTDTGTVSTNNSIRWTSIVGNGVWIAMINAGPSQSLNVSVSGRTVSVNLATNGSSAITSTANNVMAAVSASGAASALLTVASHGASTGVGIVGTVVLTEITRLIHTGNWVVNVGNRAAQDATIANMISKASGGGPWDGAFLDNFYTDLRNLAACEEFSNAIGTFPNPWQLAYLNWLDYCVPQLHTAGMTTIVGNISTTAVSYLVNSGDPSQGSKIWNAYLGSADGIAAPTLERLDGAMFESWADGGVGPAQQAGLAGVYSSEIAMAEYCQTNNKVFFGHSYFTGTGPTQSDPRVPRRYALVEALLAGSPTNAGRVMVGLNAGTNDNNVPWEPDYQDALSLGAPSGAKVLNGNGTYQRTFANGSIFWNPTAATVSGVAPYDSLITVSVSAPTNTGAPVASGTTNVGDILSCSTGTWTGSPSSFSYQWQRRGIDIAGAIANTYQIQAIDATAIVSCVVTIDTGVSANSNGIDIPTPNISTPFIPLLSTLTLEQVNDPTDIGFQIFPKVAVTSAQPIIPVTLTIGSDTYTWPTHTFLAPVTLTFSAVVSNTFDSTLEASPYQWATEYQWEIDGKILYGKVVQHQFQIASPENLVRLHIFNHWGKKTSAFQVVTIQ